MRDCTASVKQIIVPPQRFWISKGLTPQEIDSWHESMPQIRVYHVNKRMSAKGFSFLKSGFLNASFTNPKIGRALYGRHAVLWDKGQQEAGSDEALSGNAKITPLDMVELRQTNQRGQAIQAEQVSIRGMAGKSACSGRFLGTAFHSAAIKKPQIITWNKAIDYVFPQAKFSTNSLEPSLKPLDVRAKRKSESWLDKYSSCCKGRFLNAAFLMPNKAGEKLYDCLVLHDPKRAALKRQAVSFLKRNRLGMKPYRAETLIDLQIKRHPRSSFIGTGILGYHVLMPDDAKKRDGVARAVVLSKAARDEVLVSFQTSRAANFADHVLLDGKFKFNSRMNNRL